MNRTVTWGELYNARDLGGLSAGNTVTRFGRFYRTPRLDDLATQPWDAVADSGMRTIVDLPNANESAPLGHPEFIVRHGHPIEDQETPSSCACGAGKSTHWPTTRQA